jgi:hypothetical protein
LKAKNDKIIKVLQLYRDWEILRKENFICGFFSCVILPSLVCVAEFCCLSARSNNV